MIRCRGGSDFYYTNEEMDTMLADINILKDFGIHRFVFGALTINQEIDEENCLKVLSAANPIPITFHRAFDNCKDPNVAIEKIIKLGFDRILTSGQRSSASDVDAIKLIAMLVESYKDKIQIMPGSGVNAANAKTFIDLGCEIVHSSCKKSKPLLRAEKCISMGETDSETIFVTDKEIVRKTKLAIKL